MDKQFKCNSIVFYASFYEAISVLPLDSQARIYDAIFKFAFEDIEAELDGVELAVFLLVKPQLVANRVKYENGCKGGRPRKNSETEVKPNENQTETETKPNQNQKQTKAKPNNKQSVTELKPNENDNENDNFHLQENYIGLLKILKEKISSAGAYTGVHDRLVDEVLETLARACYGDRSRRYNGKLYKPSDFNKIADELDVNKICFVVNRLLQHADEIDSRPQYILTLLTCDDK